MLVLVVGVIVISEGIVMGSQDGMLEIGQADSGVFEVGLIGLGLMVVGITGISDGNVVCMMLDGVSLNRLADAGLNDVE